MAAHMKILGTLMLCIFLPSSGTRVSLQRTVCVSTTRFSFFAKLKMSCEDTFGNSGVIAVEQILYSSSNSCATVKTTSRCVYDALPHGSDPDDAEYILLANGKPRYEVIARAVIPPWCSERTTHLLVRYSCHDGNYNSTFRYVLLNNGIFRVKFRENKYEMSVTLVVARNFIDMCQATNEHTEGVADIVTPGYRYTSGRIFGGERTPLTCVCNASVPRGAAIVYSMVDLDLPSDNYGKCQGESLYNGSDINMRDALDMYFYSQGGCTRADFPLGNVTLYERTWSFVYTRLYKARQRRGLWFQIKGVSTTWPHGQVRMHLSCGPVRAADLGPVFGTTPHNTTVTKYTSVHTPSSGTSQVSVTSTPGAQSENYTGVIVGVVVGCLVAVILVASVVVMLFKRRNAGDNFDTESKSTNLSSIAPDLPARNIVHCSSIKSGTSSCHEYFEPVDENIYCIPEDVVAGAERYKTLAGNQNPVPVYFEPIGEGEAYENHLSLTTKVSNGYMTLSTTVHYENVEAAREDGIEYSRLSNPTETSSQLSSHDKLTR